MSKTKRLPLCWSRLMMHAETRHTRHTHVCSVLLAAPEPARGVPIERRSNGNNASQTTKSRFQGNVPSGCPSFGLAYTGGEESAGIRACRPSSAFFWGVFAPRTESNFNLIMVQNDRLVTVTVVVCVLFSLRATNTRTHACTPTKVQRRPRFETPA